MEHKGTQTLESERLLLRRFCVDDAQAMYENWANDPKVTKFLRWQPRENAESNIEILTDWVSHYGERDFYIWAIVLKENGDAPIGSISVVRNDDKAMSVDIGYCIGRNWWGKGITSEALRLLIDYFFREVKVNRVCARHDSNNPNSGKVMRKAGLIYEGTLRMADWNNTGICDEVVYSILAEDYFAGQTVDYWRTKK